MDFPGIPHGLSKDFANPKGGKPGTRACSAPRELPQTPSSGTGNPGLPIPPIRTRTPRGGGCLQKDIFLPPFMFYALYAALCSLCILCTLCRNYLYAEINFCIKDSGIRLCFMHFMHFMRFMHFMQELPLCRNHFCIKDPEHG